MKKVVLIASVIVTCFILSCANNSGGMSDKAQKNLEASRAVAKMFESGDFSKLGDYVAADGIDHSGMDGEIKGLDNLKAEYSKMCSMMSDMKNETVKEWADDEYTVQWLKETSTAKADEMGMKAGDRNTFNAIEVSKFNNDGKATDHWTFISWGDAMKMMPQQGAMDMMDSTGMKSAK